jgi:hypothetical protein
MSEIATPPPPSKSQTAFEHLFKVVESRGFKPKLNPEGPSAQIFFSIGEVNYVAFDAIDDAQYLRLALPGFYTSDDKLKMLTAINSANRTIKVAKAFLIEDSIWTAVEALVPNDDFLEVQFSRLVGFLNASASAVLQELGK